MDTVAPSSVLPNAGARHGAAALPWVLVAALIASTSVIVGLLWDISWHTTVGRDTLWTPAHMAIYLGGVLTGLACGFLALRTTFAGSAEERAVGVRFWGFTAPLGAWVSIWGTFAMLVSAPFDDWWHSAYGLDVQILSPPHSVLAAGMVGIQLGAMLLALAAQNRALAGGADERSTRALSLAFAWTAGVLLTMVATVVMEQSFANLQHGATFVLISAAAYPLLLLVATRALRLRWPATTVALVYTVIRCLMTWVLPLFAARPLLAPVYNPVDHFWPTPFPLLLLVPALAIDLIARRLRGRSDWLLAAIAALVFLALFVPLQWFSAEFLIGPWARNAFFGGDQWSYTDQLGPWRYQFWDVEQGPITAARLAFAAVLAMVSARLGLWWGTWMARVRR
jgi:hypothetical protein